MRLSPVVQSLTEPLLSPLVSAITGVFGGGYSPTSLFSDGSKGVFYDNNDFVDSATWRRNLLTYSEQFDNAAWIKDDLTVSANAALAPDGTMTADKMIQTAVAIAHTFRQNISAAANTTHTLYAKAAGYNFVAMTYENQAANSATFNLTTGAITNIGANVTATSATSVGNGWWRISMTVNAAVTFVRNYVLQAAGFAAETGDGTSGIFVWGAQLERGSTATTYQRITDFNSDFLAAFPSTTLYEDAAGTIPARVNGLVGLQLDKSQGLAVSANQISGGDFEGGLIGTKSDGGTGPSVSTWTLNTDSPISGTQDGRLVITGASPTLFPRLVFTGPTNVAGEWREFSFDYKVNSGTCAIFAVYNGSSTQAVSANLTGAGRLSIKVLCVGSGASTVIYFGNSLCDVQIDNISYTTIPGNHRYQTTTGSKPVLRGTPTGANLVTNGDFASGTGWTTGAGWAIGSGVATATTSSGTLTSTLAATASKNYRVTYTITRSAGSVQVSFGGRTGASRSAAGTYVDYLDSTTNTNALVFTGTTFSGTVDNVEVVDVSAGQVTAPYGLQYDGVDDFLQTAAVDFTATDKMFVCAGVRKLSDAAAGLLVELSVNTNLNNGAYFIAAPDAANTFYFASKGTGTNAVTRSSFVSPISAVLTMASNIAGPTLDTRVNAVASTTSTSTQGTGNYGNYALYFGRRGGASLPYNGLDFGMVICGKALTSTQIANTERWMSYRTGVTL